MELVYQHTMKNSSDCKRKYMPWRWWHWIWLWSLEPHPSCIQYIRLCYFTDYCLLIKRNCVKDPPIVHTPTISWLLMLWRRIESRHKQPWYYLITWNIEASGSEGLNICDYMIYMGWKCYIRPNVEFSGEFTIYLICSLTNIENYWTSISKHKCWLLLKQIITCKYAVHDDPLTPSPG